MARKSGGRIQFLLVSAKRRPDEWVLPKGRIDPGESAEDAALREVLEESGVVASIRSELDVIEFDTWRGRARVQFFLMAFEREGTSEEGRRRSWLPVDEAIEALSFDGLRKLVRQADRTLRRPHNRNP